MTESEKEDMGLATKTDARDRLVRKITPKKAMQIIQRKPAVADFYVLNGLHSDHWYRVEENGEHSYWWDDKSCWMPATKIRQMHKIRTGSLAKIIYDALPPIGTTHNDEWELSSSTGCKERKWEVVAHKHYAAIVVIDPVGDDIIPALMAAYPDAFIPKSRASDIEEMIIMMMSLRPDMRFEEFSTREVLETLYDHPEIEIKVGR